MKRLIFLSDFISFAAAAVSAAVYGFTALPALLSAAITFGTVFYHLSMRLAVGYAVDSMLHNSIDPGLKWFRQARFEPALYAALRVRKWKKYLPTFRPADFDIKKHSPADMARASCQSELVHEIIIPLSFIPVFFSRIFGASAVFWITSAAAAAFDCCFAVIQRYNRPRLLRFAERLSER